MAPRTTAGVAVVIRARLALVFAADFTDPKNERMIYLMAGGLALVGILMIVATVWWWRSTRSDHPALAPLEVMGERRFLTLPESDRRRRLEAVRPEGADPLVPLGPAPEPLNLELESFRDGGPTDFADLRFDELSLDDEAPVIDPSPSIDPLLLPLDLPAEDVDDVADKADPLSEGALEDGLDEELVDSTGHDVVEASTDADHEELSVEPTS